MFTLFTIVFTGVGLLSVGMAESWVAPGALPAIASPGSTKGIGCVFTEEVVVSLIPLAGKCAPSTTMSYDTPFSVVMAARLLTPIILVQETDVLFLDPLFGAAIRFLSSVV